MKGMRCIDIDKLRKMYCEDLKSLKACAEFFKTSEEKIRKELHKHNIPTRKSGTVPIGIYTNKDWLFNQYRTLGKSMKQIAVEQNVGETVIHKWIHRFNITPFSRSEKLTGKPKSAIHIQHLKDARRKSPQIGKLNPNWRGGKTRWDKKIRSTVMYREWRKSILERDGHKCIVCGNTEHLHAHHIISFSRYPEFRFSLGNGITLCEDCHSKAHNGNQFSFHKEVI